MMENAGMVKGPDGVFVKAGSGGVNGGGPTAAAVPVQGAPVSNESGVVEPAVPAVPATAPETPETPKAPETLETPFSFDDLNQDETTSTSTSTPSEEPAGAAAGAAVATEPSTPTSPTEEPPQETEGLQELKTLLEDSSDLSDERLKSIQTAFLATSRGKRQLQAFKTLRDLEKPVSEGGIGIAPVQDDIKTWHSAHQQLDAIRYGMESGDPTDALNSLTSLLGSSNDESLPPPPAVNTVVGQLVPYLVANHPELYREHVSGPIRRAVVQNFTQYVQALPRGADESEDRKFHSAAVFAAQLLQERFLGQSQPTEAFINGAGAAPGATSTKSAIEIENENLRRQLAEHSTTQVTQAENDFYNNLETQVRATQTTLADHALKPLAAHYGQDSEQYLGIRDRFIAQTVQTIQANTDFATQYSRDVNRAWNNIKRDLSTGAITPAQRQQAQRALVQKLDRITKSVMTNLRSRYVTPVGAAAPTSNNRPPAPPASNSTAQPGINGSSVGQTTSSPQTSSLSTPTTPPSVTVTAQGQPVPVSVAAGVGMDQGVRQIPGRNMQQSGAEFLKAKMEQRMGQGGGG
jgi:hypothetical protein